MSQKKRSAVLSPTVYAWLEVLVSTGEYSDVDDAATDLLMQVKRGTHQKSTQTGSKNMSTQEYSPVLASTHPKPIEMVPTESIAAPVEMPSLEPTIAPTAESLADELARLQGLPKIQKLKYMNRITELKESIGA